MSVMEKTLQSDGHTAECREARAADDGGRYEDIFCDGCHDWFDKPHVLANGADIAWPSGWTREQAKQWRQENGLASASAAATTPQAGPHDRKDLVNANATPGAGTLPRAGEADQNEMAPTG